jgi:hypothetical protein
MRRRSLSARKKERSRAASRGVDLFEEPGSGGIAEDGDIEVVGGDAFGEEGAVEFGLGAEEAALFPIAADEGIDVEFLEGGLGVEGVAVTVGDAFVFGGIFAGEDGRSGVHAMFEGVEAGGGLTLGGVGARGLLGVTGLYNSFDPIPFTLKARIAA